MSVKHNFFLRTSLILFLSILNFSTNFSPKTWAVLNVDIDTGKIQPIQVLLSNINNVFYNDLQLNTTQTINQIILNDLNNSGFFKAWQTNNHPQESNQNKPNFELLAQKNINLLLQIDQINVDNREISLSYKIYSSLAKRILSEQIITLPTNQIRKLAHKIADQVYQMGTGEAGYFDSRIIYVAESESPQSKLSNSSYSANSNGYPNAPKKIKRLAYMDYDGHNLKFLTDGKYMVLSPRISENGHKILYMSYQQQVPKIFMLDLLSMRQYMLGGDFAGMNSAPCFARNNENLMIMAWSQNGATNIVKHDIAAGISKTLTNNNFINTSPNYSPNNQHIVFSSDRLGKANAQIFMMHSDGSDVIQVSRGKGRYFTPVFSPKGEYIAFTKSYEGNFYIGIMRTDGSEEKILAGGYMLESPSWAPNGKFLIFSSTNKSLANKSNLYIVDISGKFHRKLDIPDGLSALDPIWVR